MTKYFWTGQGQGLGEAICPIPRRTLLQRGGVDNYRHRQSVWSLVFLQAEWIRMMADRLYIRVDQASTRWYVGRHAVFSSDVEITVDIKVI